MKMRTYHPFTEVPEELKEQVESDVKKYGGVAVQWMLATAPLKKMVEIETKENESRADIWIQLTTHIIEQLAPQDIIPPHNISARDAISEIEGLEYGKIDSEAVNMLALEISKFCQKIRSLVLGDLYAPYDDKGYLIIEEKNSEKIEGLTTEQNGIFWLDNILLKEIEKTGKEGRKAYKEISGLRKVRYQKFEETGKTDMASLFSLWISPENTLFPPFLDVIAQVLWKDQVKTQWEWEQGKHPALTRVVCAEIILPPLSGKTRIKEDKENNRIITYSGEEKEIIVVANIDITHFESALAGLKKFGSMNGHRLLRWEIEMGFNNWKKSWKEKGADPRLITIEGGYGALCEIIGCPNRSQYRQAIKSILHAQDTITFTLQNGDRGTMITLTEKGFLRNKEPSKLDIILGTFLMPNYTNLIKDKIGRRLIPIPKLPNLVSDRGTHAAQATLQLTVMKEFSDRSVEFAEQGAITLDKIRWEEMAEESGLDSKKVMTVVNGWCEYDFDNQFLDRSGDQFTIAKPFEDCKNFLIEQGKYRLKKSAENKQRRKAGIAKKRKKP